ncbi:Uncharacterised protein [Orientia tsutsugamushi]|uniref:Uncharacterized protein n=1 Tax=Orientia tsutsugamushi TaxID=784 RepID=A0A2U3RS64_ORITS|nr:hypothetical protein OTSKARP_1304 [Orientia tsutsugamushi str. Karp]SPR16066.1 Uncharacterised protein [Orientia tsutsugamushi]SPR16665.1 Uncharacterised protein [Orientia tsutsugamushi]
MLVYDNRKYEMYNRKGLKKGQCLAISFHTLDTILT